MKQLLKMASMAGVLVLVAASQVLATGTIRNLWLSAYPDVCPRLTTAANDCSLCHTSQDPGGGDLNGYGTDMIGVSDATTIENLDSDGDTVQNGTEILSNCTLPGDGDDVPIDESTWTRIKNHYR